MSLDYRRLRSWSIAPIEQHYGARDTMLYALGVGAGIPHEDATTELSYIYGPELKALPTMATVLGADPMWLRHPDAGIDWREVVHGEQFLCMHKPLPAEARIVGRFRVDEIYDKGPGKAAILFYSVDLHDAADQSLYATVTMSAFIRGQGGFGGPVDGAPLPHPLPDQHAPDLTMRLPTRPEQAAIYRLSGDYNPMHVDPDAARQAGFERPILHGLCSYGMAGRAVIALLCGGQPHRLRQLNARFTGLVYPGETLQVDLWKQGAGIAAFRVRVIERDVVALNNGYVKYDA